MAGFISPRGTIRVLGETLDLRANAHGVWRLHRPFVWLLLATVSLDAVSTMAFMSTLGVEQEYNPFIRELARNAGVVAGTSVGKLGQVLSVTALAALAPRLARLLMTVVILLNLLAFMVNMRVYLHSLG